MAKFRNMSEITKKVSQPTIFTHVVNSSTKQMDKSISTPNDFEIVDYLGKDGFGCDFFRVVNSEGFMCFYIGKKGDEFD